ncbi:MAG: hypothetical protein ACKOOF_08080 [Planctomycetaceae bacterium]
MTTRKASRSRSTGGRERNEHLFAAEDRPDWDDWIDFFSRTIDPTVREGLVEVTL